MPDPLKSNENVPVSLCPPKPPDIVNGAVNVMEGSSVTGIMTDPAENSRLPETARNPDPLGGKFSVAMKNFVPLSNRVPPGKKSVGPSAPVLPLKLIEVPGMQGPLVKH